jgi:hypothetical protein
MSRISDVQHKYRLTDCSQVSHNGLGHGPIMDQDTFGTFVRLDPSGNSKYLEWMIFQAGGGQSAMCKMHHMWHGESAKDKLGQGAAIRQDFLESSLRGFTDEQGEYHPPVKQATALTRWNDGVHEQMYRQFHVGDEDVALEGGFGFYRHWQSRQSLYDGIVETIKLWHGQQAALKAYNEELRAAGHDAIELDIYAKWSFSGYDQSRAVYGNLAQLQQAMRAVQWKKVLLDVRHDTVYDDDLLHVVCPLTVGASVKWGVDKWCTANDSNMQEALTGQSPIKSHWENYLAQGPVVYWCWKIPMPPYLWRLAQHFKTPEMRYLPADFHKKLRWINAQNMPEASCYKDIKHLILNEHQRECAKREGDAHELYLSYGNREPGRAWQDEALGRTVLETFEASCAAVRLWAQSFDTHRIVVHL